MRTFSSRFLLILSVTCSEPLSDWLPPNCLFDKNFSVFVRVDWSLGSVRPIVARPQHQNLASQWRRNVLCDAPFGSEIEREMIETWTIDRSIEWNVRLWRGTFEFLIRHSVDIQCRSFEPSFHSISSVDFVPSESTDDIFSTHPSTMMNDLLLLQRVVLRSIVTGSVSFVPQLSLTWRFSMLDTAGPCAKNLHRCLPTVLDQRDILVHRSRPAKHRWVTRENIDHSVLFYSDLIGVDVVVSAIITEQANGSSIP